MAQTYEQWKKSYEAMDDSQKKQYQDILKGKSADYIGNKYMAQYNGSSTPTTTNTNTNTNTVKTTNTATNWNLGNWSYGDDSEARQNEIRNNLEQAYAKNPTQFSSWETFANAFNYNYSWRSDKERETMKNWYDSKFPQTKATTRTQTDAVYDKNGNLHISYSDGSTEIIPWNTKTQQGTTWWATGLSADGKTYTFLPWYTPIYPEWETASDKSTAIANQWKLQQKSTTLSYQEDTPERYEQIIGNLERIYLSNPEYFTDRTTFDANFQMDQRSIGQQQKMVEWFYAKKKQERDYDAISGLTDGQSIYDAIQGGNLTYDQLDLLKWTPQYNDYLSITQDKLNLATINNDPAMFFINSMPATLEDLRAEIMATIENMTDYNMWEYMLSLYDWPEYEQVRDNVYNATRVAKEKQAEYDSIDSNVRNRLEWTWATKAYINAVIAREQNDLVPWLTMAYAQLQAEQTNYQLRHQSLQDKYQSYCDQANYEVQKYTAQINAFQTMWWVYKDVAQYDWNYKQQARLYELQESYNNPMLDSDDPDEAKRALKSALQSYYDQYGTIIKRDINQVMEDVYAYAKKNNVSLATALQKDFVDQLKAKPEYKELQKQYLYGREYLYQKAWTATKSSSSSSSSKSEWTVWATWGVTPSATWWSQTSDAVPSALDMAEVQSVLEWFSASTPEWTIGGQCGHYVNQYLDKLGLGSQNIKDSIEDKVALINDYTPEIGSILVMDSSKAPENWHVAIVIWYNESTWKLIVQDSNRSSDQTIKVHEIDPNYPKIRGYINPAKALAYNNYNGSMPNSEFVWDNGRSFKLNEYGYLDELVERYKYFNEKWEIASTASWAQSLLNAYWINEAQFAQQASNFAKYWPEAQSYLWEIMDLYTLVDSLIEWIDDVSTADLWTWEWRLWRQNYEYLVNQLTLSYFTELKSKGATFWQMSNAEWDMVKEASTQLGTYLNSFGDKLLFNQNKDAIKSLLYDMSTRYQRLIMNNPVYLNNTYNKWMTSTVNYGNNAQWGGTSGFTTDR